MVTNTTIPRSTKDLVNRVHALNRKHPKIAGGIFAAADALVCDFLTALNAILPSSDTETEGETESLPEEGITTTFASTPPEELTSFKETVLRLAGLNHHLLCALGVSHPVIEQVKMIGDELGLVSKLTGAGGGGCMISFKCREAVENASSIFEQKTRALGCLPMNTTIGQNGLLIHKQPLADVFPSQVLVERSPSKHMKRFLSNLDTYYLMDDVKTLDKMCN